MKGKVECWLPSFYKFELMALMKEADITECDVFIYPAYGLVKGDPVSIIEEIKNEIEKQWFICIGCCGRRLLPVIYGVSGVRTHNTKVKDLRDKALGLYDFQKSQPSNGGEKAAGTRNVLWQCRRTNIHQPLWSGNPGHDHLTCRWRRRSRLGALHSQPWKDEEESRTHSSSA